MRNHAVLHHPIPLARPHRAARDGVVRFVVDRSLLLPFGAAIALVWANTAAESYFRFSHAIAFAVNEIAMAFFLALVGQEVLEAMMPGGVLHSWRRWGLPVAAAGGGVLGAAAVYLLYVHLKYEVVLAQAWPIACAVDVAAAYYVLRMIWRRGSMLPFLLLLALATDAFGLLIIALRPPLAAISPTAVLLMAVAIGSSVTMQSWRIRGFSPYLAVGGTLSWLALYTQGIHPALALLPIVPFLPREPRPVEPFAEPADDDPVHQFEHRWTEGVQVVLFLFGLVNAGVILRGYGTGTWAILTAALVGRPLGILAGIGLALALGFHLPRRVGWRELVVVALATSSGFTFALFMATGLIATGPLLAELKLGALSTVVAALITIGAGRLLHVGRFARNRVR
jgi:NhaA family Na+:H+ antiporter